MTRVKYKTITEGVSAGALESINNVTLADGRTVKVVIDPTSFQFGIIDVNHTDTTQTPLVKSGSGKHLTAVKRLVRVALLGLGATLTTEKRSSTKQVIAQATAAVAAPAETVLENTGS